MRILGMLLLTVIVACEEQQKPSDTSFISLEHNLADYKNAGFLIKKVHKQEWVIPYGFIDNNSCNGEFTPAHVEQLKNQLTNVLGVWLKPLRELETNGKINKKIVDAFSYIPIRVKTVNGYNVLEKEGINTHAMDLIIHCEEGRSYAKASFGGGPTVVHMFQISQDNDRNSITDLRKYRLTTLLHEVGHAFGLADTYVDTSPRSYNRFSIASTDGFSNTVGNQPLSAMNAHYLIALDYSGKIDITDDDRAGIEWLYKRYVEETVEELDNCPDDYEHEESTNGCVPKYLFIHTARHGNIGAIQKLLSNKSDIDVNEQDSKGNTALHYAANLQYREMHGNKLYLFLLGLCNKAEEKVCTDSNIINKLGQTAKQVYNDNDNLAGFVLAINAALEQKNTLMASGLIEAALTKGYDNVINSLTRTTINTVGNITRMTMLQNTIRENWFRAAKALISHSDIDIEGVDASGYTALHYAVGWSRTEIVKKLLEKGADAKSTGTNGDNSLHSAAKGGLEEIIKKILKKGIDINSTNNDGKTPLHYAADRGKDNAVSLLLDQPNIKVNIQTIADGYTPFHLAAKSGRLEVVKILIANSEVDQALTDKQNNSACDLAKQERENLQQTQDKLSEISGNTQSVDGKTKTIVAEVGTLIVKKENKIANYNKVIKQLSCDANN